MKIIDESRVRAVLSMENCLPLMEETLRHYSRREAAMPLRSAMRISGHNLLGIMPSHLPHRRVFGSKVISVFPGNHLAGKASHQGVVLLFDDRDGRLKAVVDGMGITAVRTAAVSAVATDALARPDAEILALLGAGVQGRTHLEAMAKVRRVREVHVWDYYEEKAHRFAEECRKEFNIPCNAHKDVAPAVKDADIICTVTSAKEPVLWAEQVKPGAHINAVGACRPADREIAGDLVRRARFYADSRQSVLEESGDFLLPLKEGLITEGHMVGEIGELLEKKIPGRQSPSEITLFEALGLAVEDLACADLIYRAGNPEKKEDC